VTAAAHSAHAVLAQQPAEPIVFMTTPVCELNAICSRSVPGNKPSSLMALRLVPFAVSQQHSSFLAAQLLHMQIFVSDTASDTKRNNSTAAKTAATLRAHRINKI